MMWNSPLHYTAPASKVRAPISSVGECDARTPTQNPHISRRFAESGLETSDDGRLDNSGPRYQLLDTDSEEDDSSQEIEFSSYQMVAPPPFQSQLQRLPQEGGFDPFRQRNRDGQPEK
jgi:hypothetical protein